MLHDGYGSYTPSIPNIGSPRCGPIPPFEPHCPNNPICTPDNRVCEDHKFVLFIKPLEGEKFTIPFGNWENWDWYKDRCAEETGLDVGEFRLFFMGGYRFGPYRHSGLQYQETLTLVTSPDAKIKNIKSETKEESKSSSDEEEESDTAKS